MARRTIKQLSIIEVEYVAHRLAQELMDYGEPIPPFDTRFPDRLESCLKTPFQKFDNKSLYPGIVLKTAMIFYLMIKNHPFQNGNKRVAVLTTLYFLSENERWIKVDNFTLYEFAKKIAESDPSKSKETIQTIVEFMNTYVVSSSGDEVEESEIVSK
jgi:death-on-curing family protein